VYLRTVDENSHKTAGSFAWGIYKTFAMSYIRNLCGNNYCTFLWCAEYRNWLNAFVRFNVLPFVQVPSKRERKIMNES
jgi:hypothetical protein